MAAFSLDRVIGYEFSTRELVSLSCIESLCCCPTCTSNVGPLPLSLVCLVFRPGKMTRMLVNSFDQQKRRYRA